MSDGGVGLTLSTVSAARIFVPGAVISGFMIGGALGGVAAIAARAAAAEVRDVGHHAGRRVGARAVDAVHVVRVLYDATAITRLELDVSVRISVVTGAM